MAFFVAAAHAALKAEVTRINALNVYPVPDGDTGTNMLLTLESVLKETSSKDYETPEEAGKAGARAALMGARGNSGVILSQMIRGASEVLSERASLTAETFADALEGARKRAYSSLREPVEGTMLTVVKDAARAAREALEEGSLDLASVVRATAREAHASVRRTPELLGVLRDAGVVDAGGLGVAVILDGLYRCISGEEIETDEEVSEADTLHLGVISGSGEEAWGYCTEFIVTGFGGDVEEFVGHIHDIGKSVLVVPDDDVVKVHLHTQDPGDAISYAGGFGRLTGVKVDDMEAQVQVRSKVGPGERNHVVTGSLGVVVASRGEGSRELFESMGAIVIEGGQGANPSAADFARVVEETGADVVILLPNNKNIVPTVEQVGELVEQEVLVVRTTSIAAGLAAMVGFDAEGDAEDVAAEMDEIVAALQTAEVTRAVREANIEDRKVAEGDYIGLLDGELVASGESVGEVAFELSRRMIDDGADLLMLLWGEDLGHEEVGEISRAIESMGDGVEVEARYGGQPLYPLQMVAE